MDKKSTAKSWRDVLKIHPAADLFPLLDPEQLDQLAADIQKNGLLQPVTICTPIEPYGTPVLVDGRNRLDALERLGKIHIRNDKIWFEGWNAGQWLEIRQASNVVKQQDYDLARDDPYAYVASLNIHRRHLSSDQKREVIAKILVANPEVSDRRIAKMAAVDHKTVGAVRQEREASGEIPQLAKRTGADGKVRNGKVRPAAPRQIGNYPGQVTRLFSAWDLASPDACREFIQFVRRQRKFPADLFEETKSHPCIAKGPKT